MSVNDQILDAIELLAKSSVERAGYDKTIQAQIISCQDKQLGKYKCKYQDALFYAYTSNPTVSLSNGTMVYILVPQNDMSKDKTILGTVDKLGVDFVTIAEGEDAYEKVGINTISMGNQHLYLDTNYANYEYDNVLNLPQINLDQTELKNYINKSSSLVIAATIQTQSPLNKSLSGTNFHFDYGICFTLQFIDGTTKDYKLDIDKMVGDPLQLIVPTRQVVILPIDGENFVRVNKISIYNNYDTTQTLQTSLLDGGDIIISNLEIYGANRLSEEQLNGIIISLYTPDGSFFASADAAGTKKRIIAQIKVKGQIVPSEGVSFYWGLEDMNITSYHKDFNQYLGYGWQHITTGTGQSGWSSNSDYLVLQKSNIRSKKNRYKVAAIYDGNLITRQVEIQNESGIEITITSDAGTEFFNNTGSPNLQCSPYGGSYTHRWGWSNNGGYIQQAADIIGNVVDGYKLQQVQVFKIINYADFKCTVYDGSGYLGTATLTLTNEENEIMNSLTLINADAVFKYSTEGAAPNADDLQNPQLIKALTFILRDSNGITIYNGTTDEEGTILNTIFTEPNCVIWRIPVANTLLINENNGEPIDNSSQYYDADYDSYLNTRTISYNIARSYNYNKTNNQIKLQIHYDGKVLYGQTQFVFTKQGDIGTNGTEYTVRLVLNTSMTNPPLYPIITNANGTYKVNYGVTTSSQETTFSGSLKLFKAELWRSGERLWQQGGSTIDGSEMPTATWSILANKYGYENGADVVDDSDFIVAANGRISINTNGISSAYFGTPRANIVKCTIQYQGKSYYGTIPIITAWVSDSTNRIKLKENTGFRYVIYSADGMSPQYDTTNPFEIEVDSDTSKTSGYTFSAVGGIKTKVSSSWVYDSTHPTLQLRIIDEDNNNDNIQEYRPIDRYDGEQINNAVICEYSTTAKIRIPVHFMLNRFGQANINAWDGNSVQIDSNGGFILAPQMGAGVKDNNNRFTGVLMGKVREANKNNYNTGLFGYASGARSFFLNSDNGSAIFGKDSGGQIIIDPTDHGDGKYHAMLYSSDFWKSTNYNSQTGLPTSYSESQYNDAGMLIDLSTPQIVFKNKMLWLTSDGAIYAGKRTQNSSTYYNFSVDSSGNVQLVGDLKAGRISGTSNYNFSVSNSATGNNPLLQAGYDTSNYKYNFVVKANGDVDMTGAITANSGKIGGINGWTIGYAAASGSDPARGYIYSGSRTSLDSTASGLYIGTDGISAYKSGTGITFKVDSSGNVTINGDFTLGANSVISWTALSNAGAVNSNYVDGAIEDAIDDLDIPVLPSYITATKITQTTIESPDIYAGHFYATGDGVYNSSTPGAAYYIYDGYNQSTGTLGTKIGYISYDSNGSGLEQNQHRIKFRSVGATAIKIQSGIDLSIETGAWNDSNADALNNYTIYLMSDTRLAKKIFVNQGESFGTSDPSSAGLGTAATGMLYFKID